MNWLNESFQTWKLANNVVAYGILKGRSLRCWRDIRFFKAEWEYIKSSGFGRDNLNERERAGFV